jgi:hypothetical protein
MAMRKVKQTDPKNTGTGNTSNKKTGVFKESQDRKTQLQEEARQRQFKNTREMAEKLKNPATIKNSKGMTVKNPSYKRK